MAAQLLRLPFILLFVFLAVLVPASHGQPSKLPATYDPSMCSDSFMCGSVNIAYPFYLSTGIRREITANYTGNYSCGYSDLEISCQYEGPNETAIIRLGGRDYTIHSILYESRTIILADSNVLLFPGKCPVVVRHNVSFDEVWLHYNTSNYDELTFFIDCYSKPSGRMPTDFENYKINCEMGPGGGVSFVFTTEDLDKAQKHELASHCGENVTMPVQRDVLMKNGPYLATGGYVEVLQAGFELEWNQATATEAYQCYGCEESGGRCAYGQSKQVFLGCLCSEGKVGNPNCKNSGGASTAYAPTPRRNGHKRMCKEPQS